MFWGVLWLLCGSQKQSSHGLNEMLKLWRLICKTVTMMMRVHMVVLWKRMTAWKLKVCSRWVEIYFLLRLPLELHHCQAVECFKRREDDLNNLYWVFSEQELKELLKQPLEPKAFSRRYITGVCLPCAQIWLMPCVLCDGNWQGLVALFTWFCYLSFVLCKPSSTDYILCLIPLQSGVTPLLAKQLKEYTTRKVPKKGSKGPSYQSNSIPQRGRLVVIGQEANEPLDALRKSQALKAMTQAGSTSKSKQAQKAMTEVGSTSRSKRRRCWTYFVLSPTSPWRKCIIFCIEQVASCDGGHPVVEWFCCCYHVVWASFFRCLVSVCKLWVCLWNWLQGWLVLMLLQSLIQADACRGGLWDSND